MEGGGKGGGGGGEGVEMEGRNSFTKLGPRLGRKYLLWFFCVFDGYLGDGGSVEGGPRPGVHTVQFVCLLGNETRC